MERWDAARRRFKLPPHLPLPVTPSPATGRKQALGHCLLHVHDQGYQSHTKTHDHGGTGRAGGHRGGRLPRGQHRPRNLQQRARVPAGHAGGAAALSGLAAPGRQARALPGARAAQRWAPIAQCAFRHSGPGSLGRLERVAHVCACMEQARIGQAVGMTLACRLCEAAMFGVLLLRLWDLRSHCAVVSK